jgi:murein DD-endopeptidase MepM/ murein hydrolase activator NlpD
MNKTLKILLPTFYLGVIGVMILCVTLVINGVKSYLKEELHYDYAIDDVFDYDTIYVSKTGSDVIVKPFISENVVVSKKYYDYKSESKNQIDSIIYYKGIYFQNNGVDYESKDEFDVVSILDGEVISIEDNDVYGKVLKIKHDDNLVSIYSNIKDILVTVGYKVSTGEIIAKTNKSIYEKDDNSLLHFEVNYKNKYINPEEIYTLSVSELE